MDREPRHVGLMVESLSGYGEKILAGIARYSRQKPNWRTAFFDRSRAELVDLVGSWQGNGIICSAVEPRFCDAAAGRELPIVNVTSRQIDPVFVNVIGDDPQTGKTAAEYLLGRGFRSFGYLRRREPARYSADRWKGFSAALAAAGFAAAHFALGPRGDDGLAEWLGALPRPLALAGANDRLAAMAIDACWKLGLRVPDEVAVLGIGDYELLCNLSSPALSSVDAGMEARGYEAALWLDRLMEGEARPAQPVLVGPGKVIERESTAAFAFEDAGVVAALRFIHGNAARTIHVADVVAATGISRRSLESRFGKWIPRTLHEEIWQAHFDLATRLLVASSLSLQEIAERSGFRTASALANLFRQRFGRTPREYRLAHRRG